MYSFLPGPKKRIDSRFEIYTGRYCGSRNYNQIHTVVDLRIETGAVRLPVRYDLQEGLYRFQPTNLIETKQW